MSLSFRPVRSMMYFGIIYEGAVINFYTNGTIMVQSKTMLYCVPWAMQHKLERVLPPQTKYHLKC